MYSIALFLAHNKQNNHSVFTFLLRNSSASSDSSSGVCSSASIFPTRHNPTEQARFSSSSSRCFLSSSLKR